MKCYVLLRGLTSIYTRINMTSYFELLRDRFEEKITKLNYINVKHKYSLTFGCALSNTNVQKLNSKNLSLINF